MCQLVLCMRRARYSSSLMMAQVDYKSGLLTLGSSFMTGPLEWGASDGLGTGGVEGAVFSNACHPWKPPTALLSAPPAGAGVDTPGCSKVDQPCTSSCGAAGAAYATAGAPPTSIL